MGEYKVKPGVYSFHLVRDSKQCKFDIQASIEKGKKKEQISNLKWDSVRRIPWYSHLSCAVVGVNYVESEEQMKELFNEYHERWTKPFEQVLPEAPESSESA